MRWNGDEHTWLGNNRCGKRKYLTVWLSKFQEECFPRKYEAINRNEKIDQIWHKIGPKKQKWKKEGYKKIFKRKVEEEFWWDLNHEDVSKGCLI